VLNKNFESLKKVDENGVEYWQARELMPVLGYEKWQNAQEVIIKAGKACINSGQQLENHFTDVSKMVRIGSDTKP
jgi:DNA-damage-inducible protein D